MSKIQPLVNVDSTYLERETEKIKEFETMVRGLTLKEIEKLTKSSKDQIFDKFCGEIRRRKYSLLHLIESFNETSEIPYRRKYEIENEELNKKDQESKIKRPFEKMFWKIKRCKSILKEMNETTLDTYKYKTKIDHAFKVLRKIISQHIEIQSQVHGFCHTCVLNNSPSRESTEEISHGEPNTAPPNNMPSSYEDNGELNVNRLKPDQKPENDASLNESIPKKGCLGVAPRQESPKDKPEGKSLAIMEKVDSEQVYNKPPENNAEKKEGIEHPMDSNGLQSSNNLEESKAKSNENQINDNNDKKKLEVPYPPMTPKKSGEKLYQISASQNFAIPGSPLLGRADSKNTFSSVRKSVSYQGELQAIMGASKSTIRDPRRTYKLLTNPASKDKSSVTTINLEKFSECLKTLKPPIAPNATWYFLIIFKNIVL